MFPKPPPGQRPEDGTIVSRPPPPEVGESKVTFSPWAASQPQKAGPSTAGAVITALGMEDAEKRVQEAGVQASWDEDTRQNYAQWDADGGTYKIWLEDSQSLEEKLKLIKKNDLAGVAEWRLGWENSGVWDLISQYIN